MNINNINYIKQLKIEDNYYLNIGFPFIFEAINSEFFDSGYHFGQFASVKKIKDGLFRAVRDLYQYR